MLPTQRILVTRPSIPDREHADPQPREIQPFPPFPPELILKILRYLPQKHLRAASQSSRDFYHLSLAAGLYIRRTVTWVPSSGFGAGLAAMDQVVAYVAATRPALSIALRASFTALERNAALTSAAVVQLFASVNSALPNLVRLDLSLMEHTSVTVYAHLCAHPAPKLNYLAIEHRVGGSFSVPHDLFNGDAPNLRTLSLDLATTESLRTWASVVALQRITHLEVSTRQTRRPIALASLFSDLRSLVLGSLQPICDAQVRTIDLSGLHLDYLGLWQGTENLIDPSMLEVIPVVETRRKLCEIVYPAQDHTICANAEAFGDRSGSLSFGPAADGAWRRTVEFSNRNAALPLAEAPMVAAHLVSLTLAIPLVNAFLKAPIELASLRELFLGVSGSDLYGHCWPPVDANMLGLAAHFDEVTPAVRCPALVRVVFFAHPRGYPVTVRPTKVTRLGRALGLGAPGPTPTLTLAGCTFHDPPIWSAINKLFSGVSVAAFPDNHVPGYYRTCRYSRLFYDPKWFLVKG